VSGFVAKAVIIAIVIALVIVVVARFFRRVTPARQVVTRQRMPLLVLLAGAALLVAGAVLAVVTFAARFAMELLPARIASIVVALIGVGLIVAYRNWYLEVRVDAVRFRTVLGREKHIAYRDIASFRMVNAGLRTRVRVRSNDGVKLTVDTGRYALGPLIEAGRGAAS
jgi:hypothetical protein